MKYYMVSIGLILSSCSMFQKNISSNELENMTEDVLKREEGIDIQIKPIPKVKI